MDWKQVEKLPCISFHWDLLKALVRGEKQTTMRGQELQDGLYIARTTHYREGDGLNAQRTHYPDGYALNGGHVLDGPTEGRNPLEGLKKYGAMYMPKYAARFIISVEKIADDWKFESLTTKQIAHEGIVPIFTVWDYSDDTDELHKKGWYWQYDKNHKHAARTLENGKELNWFNANRLITEGRVIEGDFGLIQSFESLLRVIYGTKKAFDQAYTKPMFAYRVKLVADLAPESGREWKEIKVPHLILIN